MSAVSARSLSTSDSAMAGSISSSWGVRVRLTKEIPSDKLYRGPKPRSWKTRTRENRSTHCGSRIYRSVSPRFDTRHRLDENLENLLKSSVPLGVLTDIITHAWPSPLRQSKNYSRSPMSCRGVSLWCSLYLGQLVDVGEATRLFRHSSVPIKPDGGRLLYGGPRQECR